MKTNTPFAEVIESSLYTWTAECWKWDIIPSFGSIVTITSKERVLFGLVYDIKTGSSDPSRTPFAYKKTEEELLHEQPQIFTFLQTRFSCITLGYFDHERYIYQLAPEPPKIHSFVQHAQSQDLIAFFKRNLYLHLIFHNNAVQNTVDELLLALLKQLSLKQSITREQFQQFMQTFSLLTANDYRRLKIFLQRVQSSNAF